MQKSSKYLFLSIVFLVLFMFSSVFLASQLIARNRKIAFDTGYLIDNLQTFIAHPTRIKIGVLDLDLPVKAIKIENNEWKYSDDSILFVEQSGTFSEAGNKVFYGHNYPNLLRNIKDLKKGDIIEIYINDQLNEFAVNSVNVVTPDQTHILSQTEDDRITIFTCTGFLDSKRLVVIAERV